MVFAVSSSAMPQSTLSPEPETWELSKPPCSCSTSNKSPVSLSSTYLLNLPVLLLIAELKPLSHALGQPQQTVDCRFLLDVPLLSTVSPPVSNAVVLENRKCSPVVASPPFRPTSTSCSGVMRLPLVLWLNVFHPMCGEPEAFQILEFVFGFWNIYIDFTS